MSLILPYPQLGGVVSATEINENFKAITKKFDRNLTNEDFSDDAAIDISKLAENQFDLEFTLTHRYDGVTALSAASAAADLAVLPLAFPSATFTATVLDGVLVSCNDTGNGSDEITLIIGRHSSGSTWTTDETIFTDQTINNGSAADSSNVFTISQGSSSVSLFNNQCLVLKKGTNSGSGTVDSAGDFISVTVTIRLTLNNS